VSTGSDPIEIVDKNTKDTNNTQSNSTTDNSQGSSSKQTQGTDNASNNIEKNVIPTDIEQMLLKLGALKSEEKYSGIRGWFC